MREPDAVAKRRLESFVERVDDIPPLPQIAMRVLDMVQSEDTSAADLERVISSEQTLATKVLRLCNSAFYGLPRAVSSLREGLVFLGFRKVTAIVMSVAACDLFGGPVGETDLFRARLWRHSLLAAACSRAVAAHTKACGAEDAFVAGLLHDIGKTVLDRYAHDHYVPVIEQCEAPENERSAHEIEREVLGFDHADLGGVLTESWGIPAVICDPIRYHHVPEDAEGDTAANVAVCHVADGMTYGLEVDVTEDGLVYRPSEDLEELPNVDAKVLAGLGIDAEDIVPLMEKAGEEARDHESFFRRL